MIKDFLWEMWKAPVTVKAAFIVLSGSYVSSIILLYLWDVGTNNDAGAAIALLLEFPLAALIVVDLSLVITNYLERDES